MFLVHGSNDITRVESENATRTKMPVPGTNLMPRRQCSCSNGADRVTARDYNVLTVVAGVLSSRAGNSTPSRGCTLHETIGPIRAPFPDSQR